MVFRARLLRLGISPLAATAARIVDMDDYALLFLLVAAMRTEETPTVGIILGERAVVISVRIVAVAVGGVVVAVGEMVAVDLRYRRRRRVLLLLLLLRR